MFQLQLKKKNYSKCMKKAFHYNLLTLVIKNITNSLFNLLIYLLLKCNKLADVVAISRLRTSKLNITEIKEHKTYKVK